MGPEKNLKDQLKEGAVGLQSFAGELGVIDGYARGPLQGGRRQRPCQRRVNDKTWQEKKREDAKNKPT